MATVRVPTPMRRHTDGAATVAVNARTVGEALRELRGRFPGLEPWLDNGLGSLPTYTHVFLGEHDVRVLDGLDTDVSGDAELHLVAEMSGG